MGKRILIINDKSLKRRLIRHTLSKHGYEIVGEIRKGVEALSLYTGDLYFEYAELVKEN